MRPKAIGYGRIENVRLVDLAGISAPGRHGGQSVSSLPTR